MNFVTLFKAVDAVVALRQVAKSFKSKPSAEEPPSEAALSRQSAAQALGGPIEARLTNVLVAALKEAFDRDRARLDLERVQLDEQRRRAAETLRIELYRQAAEREIGRLRLLAGAAIVGWVASVVMLLMRLDVASTLARAVTAGGWLLLLGAFAAAFTAQGQLGTYVPDADRPLATSASGRAALWLLVAGLAATASSVLI